MPDEYELVQSMVLPQIWLFFLPVSKSNVMDMLKMNLIRCREFNTIKPSLKSSLGYSGVVGVVGSKYSCRNSDEDLQGLYFYPCKIKIEVIFSCTHQIWSESTHFYR